MPIMSWIFFSLLAAMIWAIGNTVDKYVLTKWVRNPLVSVIFVCFVELVAGILIFVFHGFSFLSGMNILLAFAAGILNVLMLVFYFRAVQLEEVSRVIPLFYLSPLFVSVFAAAALGEVLDWQRYLGVFLLVAGAMLISSKNALKLGFRRGALLMVFAALLSASTDIIMKYLLGFADFWTVFAYTRLGDVFALVPVLYFGMHDVSSTIRAYGRKVAGVLLLNESFVLMAILSYVIALSSGYVTLVTALVSTQSFFVLFFAVVLSVYYPKILKEEIGRPAVLLKLVAAILMFAGVVLVT